MRPIQGGAGWGDQRARDAGAMPVYQPKLADLFGDRPTETNGAATGTLNFLTAMGLFRGQSQAFVEFMTELATAADASTLQC